MVDDDLDLDLDTDAEQEPPRRRKLFARKAPPAAQAPEDGQETAPAPPEKEAEEDAARPAAVVPAKREGLPGRIITPVTGFFSRIQLPAWNVRNFLLGLLALILLVLVVENWPAMRLNFLGLHADISKSVILILTFALGFATAWYILRRRTDTAEAGGE